MSKAIALPLVPISAVALVAALLVPLMALLGVAPSINISLPVSQSSTMEWEIEDYVMDTRHTDPSHFPNHPGTKANTMVAALVATWSELLIANQGPDPKIRCGAIVNSAGVPFRIAVWVADAVNRAQGFLAVFNPSGGWITGYDRDLAGFERGPDPNKLRPGQTWDANFPCPGNVPSLATN